VRRRGPDGRIRVAHVMGELMRGGTERIVLDLLSRIDRAEFDVHVVCTTSEGYADVRRRFEDSGIAVHQVTEGLGLMSGGGWGFGMGRRKLASLLRLAAAMRRGRFTIVHTHGLTNNLYGRAAAILAGVPVIITHEHNANRYTRRDKLLWKLLNVRTALNIAVSSTVADLRTRAIPSSRKKSLTLLNGIDTSVFRPPTDEQRADAKRALGLDAGKRVVGTMSRLVPEKRVDLFLQAAAKVIPSVSDVHFLVAGEGRMKRALQKLADELNLREFATFTGWVSRPERALWAMDVFVTMSDDYEGFGLAVAEAMACGLPSICVDSPLNLEVVSGDCGIMVPPDPARVSEAMSALLLDGERVAAMGAEAARRAASLYDVARAARELEALYRDLAERRGRWGHA